MLSYLQTDMFAGQPSTKGVIFFLLGEQTKPPLTVCAGGEPAARPAGWMGSWLPVMGSLVWCWGGEMRSPFVVCAGSGGDNGGSRSSRVISRLCFSSGLEWAPQRRGAWMSLSRTWSSCLHLSSTLIWLKSHFIKAGEGEKHSALISGMVLQTWPGGGAHLNLTWTVFLSADMDERTTVAELFMHLLSAWSSRPAGSYWL